MSNEIFDFANIGILEWHRCDEVAIRDGNIEFDFEWELPNETYNVFNKFNRADTIEENEIFLEVIKLDTNSEESILNFVKKYGFLFNDVGTLEKKDKLYFEPLKDFKIAIRHVQELIELYSKAIEESTTFDELYNFATGLNMNLFENKECKCYYNCIIDILEEEKEDEAGNYDLDINESLRMYCLLIVSGEINTHIYNVHIKSDFIISERKIYEVWEPNNLLTALYYIFHLLITNNRFIRRCAKPSCREPIVIDKSNLTKIYCSSKCRSACTTQTYRDKNREKLNNERHKEFKY